MAVGKLARSQFVISGERLGSLCCYPAAVGDFPVAAEVFPVAVEVFPVAVEVFLVVVEVFLVGKPCFAEPLFEVGQLGFQLPICRRKLPLVRWRVSQL